MSHQVGALRARRAEAALREQPARAGQGRAERTIPPPAPAQPGKDSAPAPTQICTGFEKSLGPAEIKP